MKVFSKIIIGTILVLLALNYPLRAEDTRPAMPSNANNPNDMADYIANYIADNPSYLDFGVGAFDVDHSNQSAAGYVEYRYGKKLFNIVGPLAGIMANTDGGVFGYGGIYGDAKFWNLVVTPFFSVGGYHRGGSKDLGGVFQFREGITIAYEFDKGFNQGSRIGFRYAHISNAGIHDRNPGENELLLTYAIPLPF